jgi:hypothetical protein
VPDHRHGGAWSFVALLPERCALELLRLLLSLTHHHPIPLSPLFSLGPWGRDVA